MSNNTSIKLSVKTKFLNIFRRLMMPEPISTSLAHLSSGKDEKSLIAKILPPHYLYKKPTYRNVNRYGVNFRVDLSDLVDWHLYYGLSEDAHQKLYNLCKADFVVIDIGTNNGAVLLQLGKQVSDGFVYGFEPDPLNFERCTYNIKLNNAKNVSVSNIALGNHEGTATLSIVDEHNLGMNRISNTNSGTIVQVTTLDNFIVKNDIRKVDIIKVDTEGYEMSVIQGAQQVLSKWKPQLFIEVNDNNLRSNGHSALELISNLISNGYTLTRADTGEVINQNYDFSNCHFDIIGR